MADKKQDESKVPMHMRGDVRTRNGNIDAGRELCTRCNGTGNELYSMYRQCQDCGGTGKKADCCGFVDQESWAV